MTEVLAPTYLRGFRCDKPDCDAQIVVGGTLFSWSPGADQILIDNGWSRWVGRSVRHYCQIHGPQPGHSMRRTAP